jgi:2-polyprenyl-3-methyl-5-hydroxy-6-metoxy-1,4-benzoquinol methylase
VAPRRQHGNEQKHETGNPLQRRLIDRFHRDVLGEVTRVAPRFVVEIGCGEGYVLAELQAAGVEADLLGVDLSPDAIEAARRRVAPPARLQVGDAREVVRTASAGGSEPGPDLVMMLEVLEHLPEPEEILAELSETVSGHVLLSVPREPIFRGLNLARLKHVRALGNDPEHINHWGSRRFVSLVGRHFDVVSVRRPLPWTLVLGRAR